MSAFLIVERRKPTTDLLPGAPSVEHVVVRLGLAVVHDSVGVVLEEEWLRVLLPPELVLGGLHHDGQLAQVGLVAGGVEAGANLRHGHQVVLPGNKEVFLKSSLENLRF